MNSDYSHTLEENVAANWFNLSVLMMDLPGQQCEGIGSRFGLVVRRISGISIDGAPPAKPISVVL